MKHFLFTSFLGVSLIACGVGSEPVAQTPETVALLAAELPTLSGDYVWDMVESDSTLTFEAFYNGNLTGTFNQFQATIKLNPEAPETGEIHAIVDLSSILTKDGDVKANLPTEAWFDVTSHPYATFKSSNIISLLGDNFEARGDLTLKGITKPAVLTFGLEVVGDTAHATGGFEISREDFNVGTGPDFESEDWVRFPVKIMVDIKATR